MPIHSHIFDNGLTLVAEPMTWLESVAFTCLVPLGAAYDPPGRSGLSNLTCEMALRGCGQYDSRQFIEALEELGVESGESVSVSHSSYRAATLSENLIPALAVYADLLRDAQLPEDELEQGRHVAIQELRSVEDEPAHKILLELRRSHYPEPWDRPHQGDMAGLEAITIADVRRHFRQGYRPNGTIIAIAGRFDWESVRDAVGELFGDWAATATDEPLIGKLRTQQRHLHHDSNQTQIAVAFSSVPYNHPDYFQAWGAVGVLSDGSSSRLFTEVREKRGLCYAVSASPRSLKTVGSVFCYAGTTADRAQETLDVLLAELIRLGDGIQLGELDRLKARMKSSLIQAQETSVGRSGAIARDWYYLDRTRTLQEIGQLVDALTPECINAYLADNRPSDFTVVTLGPSPLEMPVGISQPEA
jgi:predicted Zn-dependent peptidase